LESAALETMLLVNGHELDAAIDAAETTVLGVASGAMDRQQFTEWARAHCTRASQ
jgi:death on curing protein